MFKVALINDIHFGLKSNNDRFHEIQRKFFYDQFIPYVKHNKLKEIWIGGDVFDSRTLISPKSIQLALGIVEDLSKIVSHVRILMGNHDVFMGNDNEIHSLTMFKPYATLYTNKCELIEIQNKTILFVPWLVDDKMKEEFLKIVNEYEIDICYGHFEINGFEMGPDSYCTHGFTTEIFEDIKKVYSGHFHIRANHKHIQYIGAPYQMSMGDARSNKGFEILDIDTLSSEFIINDVSPKHKKVFYSEVKEEDLIKDMLQGNFVNVYFDEPITEEAANNYSKKIEEFGAISLKVEFQDKQFLTNKDTAQHVASQDISDLIEFFKIYMNKVELAEGLDKDRLVSIVENIYEKDLDVLFEELDQDIESSANVKIIKE